MGCAKIPDVNVALPGTDGPMVKYDFSDANEARLLYADQPSGNTYDLEYSTTGTSGWTTIVSEASGSGIRASAWTAIPGGAQADVYVRMIKSDGETDSNSGQYCAMQVR